MLYVVHHLKDKDDVLQRVLTALNHHFYFGNIFDHHQTRNLDRIVAHANQITALGIGAIIVE